VQQTWIHVLQIDVELQAAQCQDELAGEQAALDAQLTELHRCKATLLMKCAATIDFTKAQAWARAVTATINNKGMPRPTFARASQNVATSAALLDTLPMPSTNEVGRVYH
jgi:hypothetical protein